jgi:N utilization substance protein B
MLFASTFWPDSQKESGLLVLDTVDDEIETKNYSKLIFLGILKNEKEIEEIISRYLENWKMDRLFMVDKCIIQVAVYEMMFLKDAPPSVVIDQAVRLAKKFGGDESGRFVNGMLGAIFRNWNENATEEADS